MERVHGKLCARSSGRFGATWRPARSGGGGRGPPLARKSDRAPRVAPNPGSDARGAGAIAPAASSTAPEPRSSSASAIRRPIWSSWARLPAPTRTPRASPSWGERASSSPRSSRRWGCGARTSTSAHHQVPAAQQPPPRGGRDRGLPAVPAEAAPGHRAQVSFCSLGGPSTQTLLQTKEAISRLRGKFHDYHGIPLLPTFHPAFLLRNPSEKKTVWEDMKLLMQRMRQG